MAAEDTHTACTGRNKLICGIMDLVTQNALEEKWLLAPSLRVGFQWLDAVARSGQPVLNARVKTVAGMALELAAPEMAKRGVTLLRRMQAELLVSVVLARLREKGGYLGRLEPSPGLVRAAMSTLRDLRLAGVEGVDLQARLFEVAAKGREIAYLLQAYEEELNACGLVDLAGALRLAARRLETDDAALPRQGLVAVPEDMLEDMRGLERALWEAVPADRRILLETDRPGERRGGGDSSLLSWVSRPGDAPQPTEDGSVEIFRAVGEVNEAREVLRRCTGANIPFDQVEILYTDASTYMPLIYEVCALLSPEPEALIPATFLEGIPVRYSRPGRALAAWLSWIAEDFPQAILVRMVQDGLLNLGPSVETFSFSRIGAVLRALPIGRGRGRYVAAIDAELDSLAWRISHPELEGNGEDDGERTARLERRMEMLRSLRVMVDSLLAGIPVSAQDRPGLLRGAESFLTRLARGTSELDEYGRMRLLDDIREFSTCFEESGADLTFLDIRGWLAELARTASVEGKGPRPGCLYVAPLKAGGHSGRTHTFILGLDDGRFPGAGMQDPLLLDSERSAISEDLPTAAGRLAASLEDFSRLAARIRGRVTLSYCCRSLTDDRDMFPSPVLLAAYRVITGDHEGVQDDLVAWLPEPVSFAPREPELCLYPTEWWLCRLLGQPAVEDPVGTVAAAFSHLARGLEARRARESDLFTVYDGYVPEAGADLDPTRPDGPVLSASRLETLGRCPFEYFLAYVLGVKPPEEYALDPNRWLEPTEKGSLLHSVFQRFHSRLLEEDRRPVFERDLDLLKDILEDEIGLWVRRKPPPSREVLAREVEDLRLSSRIFLLEEEEHCRGRRPLYFEVAIGMEADAEGNPVDSPEPLEIELPGGKAVRTRGYIDRIDELGDPGSLRFAVCDYKTGSGYGYERDDPFRQGRRIQNLIYMTQAQLRLGECHPGAEVASFQYFFPSTREHGERIEWDAGTLASGMAVLEKLCEMLARGCFPFADNKSDVSISDYRPYFGDIEANAEAIKAKLCNTDNENLAPFRELRGYGE
jgi:ATP-dependent helicase/nuclease subunit B